MRHHFAVGDVVQNTATGIDVHYLIIKIKDGGYDVRVTHSTVPCSPMGFLQLANQHLFAKVLNKPKIIDNKYKITRK